jgi:hypothetical protein
VRDEVDDYEVHLVSDDLLSTNGLPTELPLVAPTLSGRVFERTADGVRPISGASIVLDFTGGDGWAPSANTYSNSDGRYVMCNVVDASGLGIAAMVTKTGFRNAFVPVRTQSGTLDIELRRE